MVGEKVKVLISVVLTVRTPEGYGEPEGTNAHVGNTHSFAHLILSGIAMCLVGQPSTCTEYFTRTQPKWGRWPCRPEHLVTGPGFKSSLRGVPVM